VAFFTVTQAFITFSPMAFIYNEYKETGSLKAPYIAEGSLLNFISQKNSTVFTLNLLVVTEKKRMTLQSLILWGF